MSALTFATDRPGQESEFLAAIRSVKPEVFSQENAAAFVKASAAIAGMAKAGFSMDQGFEKNGIEHLTPIGLYNMMAKDLLLKKGEKPPTDMPVTQVDPVTKQLTQAYQSVLNAAMDMGKLTMHTLGNDPEMAEFSTMTSLMTVGDGVFLGRCLEAGITVDLNALQGLSRKEMVGLTNDPQVIGLLQTLPSKHPLITGMNEINGLIMLRPDELKEHLLGPARVLIPDELLNHGFHCAVSAHVKPEALEIWLKAGASVEGSSRNLFEKTALGSAIFASPLRGGPLESEALEGTMTANVKNMTTVQAKDLGGILAAAQANGTKVIGVLPGKGGTIDLSAGLSGPSNPEPPERCKVELLIAQGAQVNPSSGLQSPLAQAYENGSLALIDLLTKNKAQFRNNREKLATYLVCAEHGSNGALGLMWESGVGIDTVIGRQTHSPTTNDLMTNEHTALTMAAMMGCEKTVDLCLKAGANPEIKVTRTIAHPNHDESQQMNFLQEALRLDQPKVLVVAVTHLGIDRVLQEKTPTHARECQKFMQGLKASQALETDAAKLAPTSTP